MLDVLDAHHSYSLSRLLRIVLLIAIPATILLAVVEMMGAFAPHRLVLFVVLVLGEVVCLVLVHQGHVKAAFFAGITIMLLVAAVLSVIGSPLNIGYFHLLLIATTISGWLSRWWFVLAVAGLAAVVVAIDILVMPAGVLVQPSTPELGPAALLWRLFFLALAAGHGLLFVQVSRLRRNENRRLHHESNARDLLLREARHRTINGYNQLSSILELELARAAPDEHHSLRSVKNRVHALGRAAAAIDTGNPAGDLDVSRYITELVAAITEGYGRPEVSVVVDIGGELRLPGKEAAAVGLIVNEAITNSYKHAFGGGKSGSIQVVGGRSGEVYRIAIHDNGRAGAELPPGHARPAEPKPPPEYPRAGHGPEGGMGMAIMRALATEFSGTVHLERTSNGATLTVEIPLGTAAP